MTYRSSAQPTRPDILSPRGTFATASLLTPVTAHVMAQVITGEKPDYEISAFSPLRFQEGRASL